MSSGSGQFNIDNLIGTAAALYEHRIRKTSMVIDRRYSYSE
jgi:hypothetical protein